MRGLQRQVYRAKEARLKGYKDLNGKSLDEQIREIEERIGEIDLERLELSVKLSDLKDEKRKQKAKKSGVPIVWAKMVYVCEDCGKRFDMYLENTLERNNGDKHKPVPFGIRCKFCGGFHCYDRSGLIPLPAERPVDEYESYFEDNKKYDCGHSVYR